MEMLKSGLIPNILLSSGKLKEFGVTVEQLKSEGLFVGMKGQKVQIKTELLFDQLEGELQIEKQKPLNNVRPQDVQSQVSLRSELVQVEAPIEDNGPPQFDDVPLEAYGDDWRGEVGEFEIPDYSDVPDEFTRNSDDHNPVQKEKPIEPGVDYLGENGNFALSKLDEEVEFGDVYELTSQRTVPTMPVNQTYQIQLSKEDIMSMFQSEHKAEMGACTVLIKGIRNGSVIPVIPGAEALDVELELFEEASIEFLKHKMSNNACPKMKVEQTQLVVKTLWNKLQVNNFCTLEVKQGG